MFLEKYKSKRRLGKGAYGDVYLVEDDKGCLYALKLISMKMIEEEPHLREYLDGEIDCMKSMNSTHIIKLYEVHEDETSIYLLLEYCDGGDLINYQAKLKDKVFTLEKASEALSEVIIGLEKLHQEGYLHRDIKSQNVLIKYENGKEVHGSRCRSTNWLISGSARRSRTWAVPS
jgi:serine/threonine protein kinase